MNAGHSVWGTCPPHHRTSTHSPARRHADFGQVGNGDLEAGDWFDGDGAHSGDRAGECNPTGHGCPDRLTELGVVVDAKVSAVLACRRESGYDRAVDRRTETDCSDSKDNQHHSPPMENLQGAGFRIQRVAS